MVWLQHKEPPTYPKNYSSEYFGTLYFCEGTIINPRVILTAAHCLWDVKLGKLKNETTFKVVAKTTNRLKKTQRTEVLEIKEVILHPDYNAFTSQNDIAIMDLMSNINEDDVYAQRINLADGPVEVGTRCTVPGWGTIFEDGPLAADALYADMFILEGSLCQLIYGKLFTAGQLCLGDPEDPEQSVCQGNSGSPLICYGKVTGVVSHGYGCGELTGIHADVWYYRDWIDKVITAGKSANNIRIFQILLLLFLVLIVS